MMLAALWLCASGSLLAQTFTTLYLFGGGGNTDGGLVQGTDGNLYGATGKEDGMIFKITPSGTFTTLHSGGGEFSGALIQGTDGNFYGQSLRVGPSTLARSSKSPQVARSRRCTISVNSRRAAVSPVAG
jgi:uncharacterized repeat protein (TIGR03803 family)